MDQTEAEAMDLPGTMSAPAGDEPAGTAAAPETDDGTGGPSSASVCTETVGESRADREPAVSWRQAVAYVLRAQDSVRKVEEAVRHLKQAQGQRFEEIDARIDASEQTVLARIADLEGTLRNMAHSNAASVAQSAAALAERMESVEHARSEAELRAAAAESVAAAERARLDAYRETWESAPLMLRLRFVRELLSEDHPLQSVLKEAAALEELRRRGRDLETWLTNYPSLFADAAQALEPRQADSSDVEHGADRSDGRASDTLAEQTLLEVRSALETTLRALGITWVAPLLGDAVTAEHEVIGEELSSSGDGRVARLRRRGFRIQGRLAVPAQVMRSTRQAPAGTGQTGAPARPADGFNEPDLITARPESAQNVEPATRDRPLVHVGTAPDLPDWLRILGQRTFGCDIPSVTALAAQVIGLRALPERITVETTEDEARKIFTNALYPLIPLLGLRYADGLPDIPETWGAVFLEVRDPLLSWLDQVIGVRILAPLRGARIDPLTMASVETRRTVHANEHDTVARVERVGLLWHDRPITPAQVVRYATEGNL